MNRDMRKRIVAIIMLCSLLLGLIPMIALATEADATIRQTVYKEGISVRVSMTGPEGVFSAGSACGNDTAEPISAMVLAKAADSGDPSIGIIGGADGPTAVLVSGNWGGLIAIAAAVLCSGICMIMALKKRKK